MISQADQALMAWRACWAMRQTADPTAALMAMEQLGRLRDLTQFPAISRFAEGQLRAEVLACGGFATCSPT